MSLSPQDAPELMSQVADLTRAGLPLAQGLRAAAEESRSSSLAVGMRLLADELEKGKSLESCLAECEGQLPPHLVGLIRAGIASGQLGHILAELAEHQALTDETYYRIYSALMYPLVLVAITAALFLLGSLLLVPHYRPLLEEFDTQLPWITTSLFWMADTGLRFALVAGAAMVVLAIVVRLAVGAARWQWLLSTIPVFGALWLDAATSELARLLAMLVDQRVPMPEALQLAASAMSDANVAEACRSAAADVKRGESVSQALALTRRLPTSLIPILEWGERTNAMSESLESADQLFLGRMKLRASFVAAVFPPLILLTTVALIGFIVGALLLPLVSLISNLAR